MPEPSPATELVAFHPSSGYPDQLRPRPQSVSASRDNGAASVMVWRGGATVDLSMNSGGFSCSLEFHPTAARLLARDLLSAAALIESGGAR